MPTTQDTEYSTKLTQDQEVQEADELEDDDSWHMDEKFRANQTWTPYGFVNTDKDDTTWSTLPSRSTSQHGDTGPVPPSHPFADALQKVAVESSENWVVHAEDDEDAPVFDAKPHAVKSNVRDDDLDVDMDIEEEGDSVDLDEILAAGKQTVSLVSVCGDEVARNRRCADMDNVRDRLERIVRRAKCRSTRRRRPLRRTMWVSWGRPVDS